MKLEESCNEQLRGIGVEAYGLQAVLQPVY